MSPNAPAFVRILWAASRSFGQRRRICRLWLAFDTHPALVTLRNWHYRAAHPVQSVRMWRMLRILRSGRGFLQA